MTVALEHIAAFDLSLTSTGWARGERCGALVPPKNATRGVDRLRWIRGAILERAALAVVVVIEGYSFSSRESHAHALGELGGVVRVALTEAAFRWVEVPPSSLKLFATGAGNAKKELVLGEAIRKLEYSGSSTDEADALWLAEMAYTHYADTATNEAQRRALKGVQWPAIGGKTP